MGRVDEVIRTSDMIPDQLPTELVERILALLSYEEKVAVLGVCKRYINRSLVDQANRFFPKMENNTAERNRATSARCQCGRGALPAAGQ